MLIANLAKTFKTFNTKLSFTNGKWCNTYRNLCKCLCVFRKNLLEFLMKQTNCCVFQLKLAANFNFV